MQANTGCVSRTRCPSLLVALLVIFTLLVSIGVSHARSVYEEVSNNPQLSKFKEWADKDDILVLMMKRKSVTVFAPTNQAIAAYLQKNAQLNPVLVNYHASSVSLKCEQFPTVASSLDGRFPSLYLAMRNFGPISSLTQSARRSENDKFFYVNNAYIMESRENLLSEKSMPQVLHIIDEVLTAYEPSGSSSTAPNALAFIMNPSLFELGQLDLSDFMRHIQHNRLESLFSGPGQNTYFVPSKPPLPGAPSFDKYVVKAHVVNKPLFVRTLGDKKKYSTAASDASVEVELSLMNSTNRFAVEKTYYIQTNTVKDDATHKLGKVLSRLTLANIPVSNGIIHVIDRPLMLMDMSVRDFLRAQNKLSRFQQLLDKHPEIVSEMNRQPNKTILAPEDNAFVNLEDNNQNFSGIDDSSDEMKKLLRQHIVYASVSAVELKKRGGHIVLNSSAAIAVGFRLVGVEPNMRITVESGGVNATSSQSDFGASDGIIHIVDRVLGMPFNTMREKLRTLGNLTETAKIGEQGGAGNWNSKLADENKRYTFFAPTDQAWALFGKDNPSEFKQLDTGLYPPISRTILDRHLSAKGQFNRKDLMQTVKKVDTIQGELTITPEGKELFIEWEGKKARIIQSDIYALNGVIHTIDQVLAKKRDFKVNSATSTAVPFMQVASLLVLAILTSRVTSNLA